MATKLTKAIKREVSVGDRDYTVTIGPEGLKVVEKGRRKGQELSWESIVTGDAALARDLRISVDATGFPRTRAAGDGRAAAGPHRDLRATAAGLPYFFGAPANDRRLAWNARTRGGDSWSEAATTGGMHVRVAGPPHRTAFCRPG